MSTDTKILNRYALLAALVMALGPLAALSLGSQAQDAQAAGSGVTAEASAADTAAVPG